MRGQRHAPAVLYPRERPCNHCTGGWVGPRAGLDRCGKTRPHRDRSPDRSARSQSLYRLRYPDHCLLYDFRNMKRRIQIMRFLTTHMSNITTVVPLVFFNPLNAELNPICHLLALLGVQHFLHVSSLRVKSLTLRLLMSYTGCPRRNVPDFERVFLMLKYTDITKDTYVQSWTLTKIMAREVWNFDSCYTLVDYQIHIKTGRNMWFLQC